MSVETQWAPFGRVPAHYLQSVRLECHHAVQWLARMARAGMVTRDDDSHTNLGWDENKQALLTHPLDQVRGTVQVGFSFADASLMLIAGGNITVELSLHQQTDQDVGTWINAQAQAMGLDPQRLHDPLPYDVPWPGTVPHSVYNFPSHSHDLRALGTWFANGHILFSALHRGLANHQPVPAPARVWPHHFDLGMLLLLEAADPETARSIGLGLSPGDDLFDEPYFYVTPYPQPRSENLPALQAPSFWLTDGFVGAVIRGSDLEQAENPQATAVSCIRGSIKAAIALVA